MKNINDSSQTKIIATIGPACDSKDVLRKMFRAGIDTCRLNFSHGDHDGHRRVIEAIRDLNDELGTHVGIIADLQGPKLRIGEVGNGSVLLEEGRELSIVTKECVGNGERLYLSYADFPRDAAPGGTVLIDDGKVKLQITSTNGTDEVRVRVVHGGMVSSRKGVNLPDTAISAPSLTEKDLRDLDFIVTQPVDWIALSFVRRSADIVALRRIIQERGAAAGIIAKIEKPEALDDIDAIIDAADAVMIARGDLGVEMPFVQVPYLQKVIVDKCISKFRPVIIATQMLESMMGNFRPTRAEASDVANAVFDGADCLMLSGETSVGKFPVESIQVMQSIIEYAEGTEFNLSHEHAPMKDEPGYLPDSVCYNACRMANDTDAKAIVTFTSTGAAPGKISSHRPRAAIYACTSNRRLLSKLSLVWGVRVLYSERLDDVNRAIAGATMLLKKGGVVRKGDTVVYVGGLPALESGVINMMKIDVVE